MFRHRRTQSSTDPFRTRSKQSVFVDAYLWPLVIVLAAAVSACGKKGPPLAPLNMGPDAPQAVTARRLGDTVYLTMTVPAKAATGSGPFSVDHLEVYAATLAPGSTSPPNRDLLRPQYVIAKIPVRPPVDPEAAPPEGEEDKRPGPGDVVTFVEKVTSATLAPQQVGKPPPPPKAETAKPGATATPPLPPAAGAPVAPVAPTGPTVLTRLYVVRGVASNGHSGSPSARLNVPLLAPPGAPRGGAAAFDEGSVILSWDPPASPSDETPGVTYNVYPHAVPAAGTGAAGVPVSAPVPLNTAPLQALTHANPGAAAGKEQCFVVRSVATVGDAAIESDPSNPICVTPRDTFAPVAPKGLAAVSGTGVVNLIWDPNTDADLGGYLILRGEAPGDTLQPLTPEPIKETRYADRSAKPGTIYVYAIVAVDRATPPNRSALSNKVTETAR
jgi:predicted small lipoprotein YifL